MKNTIIRALSLGIALSIPAVSMLANAEEPAPAGAAAPAGTDMKKDETTTTTKKEKKATKKKKGAEDGSKAGQGAQ